MQDMMRVSEVCKLTGWSRANIYFKKRHGKLNIVKVQGRAYVLLNDIKKNIQALYSRSAYFAPGETGIKGAAHMLGISKDVMYGLIVKNKVPYRRVGALYIIKISDLKTEQFRFEFDQRIRIKEDAVFRRIKKNKKDETQIQGPSRQERLNQIFLEA